MSIPNHVLDQLCSQADLVSIIGRHTTLKRAGREFKGCCPFHGEKTPSFYVNPQKNVYNCFGCGVGGNAISFLRDYENLTFQEAIKELSQQTGIEIPKEDRQDLRYTRRPAPKPMSSPTPSNTRVRTKADMPVNTAGHTSNNHTATGNNNGHIDSSSTSGSDVNKGDASTISNDETLPAYLSTPESMPSSIDDYYANYDGGYVNDEGNRGNEDGYQTFDPLSMSISPMPSVNKPSANNMDNNTHNAPSNFSANPPTHLSSQSSQFQKEGNLYELLERIQAFYEQNLQQHSRALAYFKDRGLSDTTIATFGLGYAPTGWQHLEQHFAQDIEGLKALGLVRLSEKGREYDLLRDRVIFPIRDNQGRTIGFAGRALDNEVKPKYINSSDSPVFHKQHVLYGYFESRQQRCNDWLVVEGYMDVIALYQAGIYGAVAPMGTAVNESQIARLLQMNPTLTLCFDGDSAGQKAAWRTLEVSLPILSDDKELRFLTLPNSHDPDTFIQSHGIEAMQAQIRSAIPLSQYVFAYLSERYDLTLAEGKAKLMAQVRALTGQLPKGSSFRYLLNNDIYQRLGGRNNQKAAAHDALLDFDSDMTISVQLELCLLFDPECLAEDPIKRIWQCSGIYNMQLPNSLKQDDVTPEARRQRYELAPLPTWHSFGNARLTKLTTVIQQLLPFLPEETNAAAHFILANLPSNFQQPLAQRWQGFFLGLTHRGIIDIDDLTEDLLVQLLLQALTKQLSGANNIVVSTHINRQRQILTAWHKQQQIDKAEKAKENETKKITKEAILAVAKPAN